MPWLAVPRTVPTHVHVTRQPREEGVDGHGPVGDVQLGIVAGIQVGYLAAELLLVVYVLGEESLELVLEGEELVAAEDTCKLGWF